MDDAQPFARSHALDELIATFYININIMLYSAALSWLYLLDIQMKNCILNRISQYTAS